MTTVTVTLPSKPDAHLNTGSARAALHAVTAGLARPQHRSAERPYALAGADAVSAHAHMDTADLTDDTAVTAAADLLADLLHLATAAKIPTGHLRTLCDRHRTGALVPATPADRTTAEGIAMTWNNVCRWLKAKGLDVPTALHMAHRYFNTETVPAP